MWREGLGSNFSLEPLLRNTSLPKMLHRTPWAEMEIGAGWSNCGFVCALHLQGDQEVLRAGQARAGRPARRGREGHEAKWLELKRSRLGKQRAESARQGGAATGNNQW